MMMKKLMTLLLLLIVMVSTASADWYLKGEFDSWGDGYQFTFLDNDSESNPIYTVTLNLAAGITKEFAIVEGSTYWKSSATMTLGNSEDWTLKTSDNNIKITTSIAGDYVFRLKWYNSTPHLTVIYPSNEKTILHFKKPDGWTAVAGYRYNTMYGKEKNWPGTVLSANANNSGYYDYVLSHNTVSTGGVYNKVKFNNNNSGSETDEITIDYSKPEYWITFDGSASTVTTTIPDDFTYTYTRTVTNGSWGTICLPYFANVSGADIYTIVYADEADTPGEIYLSEVNDHNMTKGHAYIFKATSSTLTATLTGELFTGETELSFYMKGNLGATIKAPVGSYVIQGDKIRKVVSGGDGVNVGQFRAYIDLTGISPWPGAPGLDLVPMSVYSDNTPTGMSDALHLDNSDETKDHTVYDLQGRKVAKAAANSSLFTLHSSLNPGLYIVNGKKVIMK